MWWLDVFFICFIAVVFASVPLAYLAWRLTRCGKPPKRDFKLLLRLQTESVVGNVSKSSNLFCSVSYKQAPFTAKTAELD
jgi:hypothetical protein